MKQLKISFFIVLIALASNLYAMKAVLLLTCFGPDNPVQTSEGMKPMKGLDVGMKVIVGYEEDRQPIFDYIQTIKHSISNTIYNIRVADKKDEIHTLSITPNHIIYANTDKQLLINSANENKVNYVKVENLTNEHFVILNGHPYQIISINKKEFDSPQPVYFPMTEAGSIEVAGILCACQVE